MRAPADSRSDSAPRPSSALHKVAIVGFGTVGSSVARILSQRDHGGLRLTYICNRNLARKKRPDWLPAEVEWTEDFNDILASDVEVVVEVIGGLAPSREWVRQALESGKSVVTANKQLIAHCGPELVRFARQQQRSLAFGASVAGGIPVISGLQEGLAGDELFKIYGILNGTCNYILTQIESGGLSFSEALAEAQRHGFAEADPSDDINGLDARAKITILTRIGLNSHVDPSDIVCRSIAQIEAVDFEYAKQLGCTIRQISRAELKAGQTEPGPLFASVQPALVELASPLAQVQGAQNLVVSTGKFGGETIFGGHGAGGNPTAVAIVSDLIAVTQAQPEPARFGISPGEASRPVSADFTTRHYLRFTVKDRPGIIASLAEIFSSSGINIDSVLQKPGYPKSNLPFVIALEACKASLVETACLAIARLDFLVEACVHLPILD